MPVERLQRSPPGGLPDMLRSESRGTARRSTRRSRSVKLAPRSGTAPADLEQALRGQANGQSPREEESEVEGEASFLNEVLEHFLVFQAREGCISAVRLDPCALQDELMRYTAQLASVAWQVADRYVRVSQRRLEASYRSRVAAAEEAARRAQEQLFMDLAAMRSQLDAAKQQHDEELAETMAEIMALENDVQLLRDENDCFKRREAQHDAQKPAEAEAQLENGSAPSPYASPKAVENILPGIFKRPGERKSAVLQTCSTARPAGAPPNSSKMRKYATR